jgi:hypothetical protein
VIGKALGSNFLKKERPGTIPTASIRVYTNFRLSLAAMYIYENVRTALFGPLEYEAKRQLLTS